MILGLENVCLNAFSSMKFHTEKLFNDAAVSVGSKYEEQ
jgi:hypothetical protein